MGGVSATTEPAADAWQDHFTGRLDSIEASIADLGNQRSADRNPNISSANTLIQVLGELKHIRAALTASSDSRSSVEVKTSTRGVDIASKCYEGSPMVGLDDEAVAKYFSTLEKVQARLNGGTGQ